MITYLGSRMNYVKAYLKRNKMTREQLAKELEASLSFVDKLACDKLRLRKIVRLAMERLEMD